MYLERDKNGTDIFNISKVMAYNHITDEDKSYISAADNVYMENDTSFSEQWELSTDQDDLKNRIIKIAGNDEQKLIYLFGGLIAYLKILKLFVGDDDDV